MLRIALRLVLVSAVCSFALAQSPPPTPTLEDRLRDLEQRVQSGNTEIEALRREIATKQPVQEAKPGKWYDRISLKGYGQVRFTSLFGEDNTPSLNVPNDRSVNEPESIYLRRGRVTLSGDVTDHVYLYAQTDFAGTPSGTDYTLQMRDFYSDIAVDADKELRFRLGLSKVPFGWVNLQSSQNRAALERPDALNSAAEGERDLGAYVYWAPKEIRERFRDLVKSGRKGSGDYGVIGLGAYAGQGPNRPDQNGDVHWVARAAYPFEFADKQVLELGVQAYTGEFVVGTQAINGTTPVVDIDGVHDQRVGVTAVWYPQPFGLEAEWNWGRGPQLSNDLTQINDESLHGGYVQASWLQQGDSGTWFPFVRWNLFDGARKFARNAPRDEVNELDGGFEWSPWPEIEMTAMFTHTFRRTDTSLAPYLDARGDDRVGLQMQWNF